MPQYLEPLEIKRGDDFGMALIVEVDGVVQDLTNWKIRAAISSRFGVVAKFAVTVTDAVHGEFELDVNTAACPLGNLSMDIRFITDANETKTTESVPLLILQNDTP